MRIITVGIDLGKNVFAMRCMDKDAKVALVNPTYPRTTARADRTTAGAPD